jgi:hypothetical protein
VVVDEGNGESVNVSFPMGFKWGTGPLFLQPPGRQMQFLSPHSLLLPERALCGIPLQWPGWAH